MRLITNKIILRKSLFGSYSAYYKEEKIMHKFADNILEVIYHGDIDTSIGNIIIIRPMMQKLISAEYLEKSNRLIIDTTY